MFGGLILNGPTGPVGGRAVQRHRLALLALLAVHHQEGVRRDKLIAFLWPESDEEKARHLLSDAVYVLRKALGECAIVTAGDVVQLGDTVWTDVRAFSDGLSRRDFESALALYAGPFLDGFHLPASHDFDRWREARRSSYDEQSRSALRSLANAAEASGDFAGATGWWSKLARQDSYSSSVMTAYMRALIGAGDPAAALKVGAEHARRLHDDLGMSPAPEVVTLLSEVRASARAAPASDQTATAPPRVPDGFDTRELIAPGDGHAALTEVAARGGRPRWLWVGIVIAVLATGLAAMVRGFGLAARGTTPSIAVLPFVNESGRAEDLYFTDGMHEAILTELFRVGDVNVRGRTSVWQYRHSDKPLSAVARELDADHVLIGAVLRSPGRVRIQVRLIHAETDRTVWSKTYDRELSVPNMLGVQSEVALGVADALEATLTDTQRERITRTRASNLTAYESVLRAQHALGGWGRSEDLEAALISFARALDADSTYAPAWAGASHALRQYVRAHEQPSGPAWQSVLAARALRARINPALDQRAQVSALMASAAERAIKLDSTLASAFTAVGTIRTEFGFDPAGAEVALLRAIELAPSDPQTHSQYAIFLTALRRHREALQHWLHVTRTDPGSVSARVGLAESRFFIGQQEDGLRELRAIADQYPTRTTALWSLALRQGTAGRYDDAIQTLRRVMVLMGPNNSADEEAYLGYLFGVSSQPDSARAVLKRLDEYEARGVYVSPIVRAWPFIGMRDFDSALHWLRVAVQQKEPWLAYHRILPAFDPIRHDPRFQALLRPLALVP